MADHHDDEQAHIGPDAHLPDPSVWPLLVGVAFFLVGAAIVWWSRDRDSTLASIFAGAAIVATFVAVGGWSYEDSRMKKKAESGERHGPRDSRYTQVITFAIPEGQFEAANSSDGVVTTIDATDSSLRDLAGFQDLRISASPAEAGPSQVLVETTWSDREGLATYDETRQSVLDIVNRFDQQVVPGSVQVFDMMVVRDTKDVALRFGMGSAATLIGGLALGGFLIGAGITVFESDHSAAAPVENGGGGAPSPGGFAETGVIVAVNTEFDPTEISLPPETEVTLTLDNQDASPPHNIRFFDGEDATAPSLTGCTDGCPTDEVATEIGGEGEYAFTFTTPGPGTYFYHCDLHPVEMTGFLTVEEGAPVPGSGGGGGNGDGGNGGGAPSGDFADTGVITAVDITFVETEISLAPETEVTLTLDNQDESPPHNIRFFDGEDADAPSLTGCTAGCPTDEVATEIGGAGQYPFTFTTPAPGRYFYHCDLHPVEMTGFLTVEEGGPAPGGGGGVNGDAGEGEGDNDAAA